MKATARTTSAQPLTPGLITYVLLALLFPFTCTAASSASLDQQPIKVEDDQFSPVATIVGEQISDSVFSGMFKVWFIRSFIDKQFGVVRHQLYVDASYLGSWHFYESAYDDTATALPFVQIARKIGDCRGTCDFDEAFGLNLDDSALRKKAEFGFAIKVSAKDGTSFIVSVTAEQIRAQLAAVDDYKAVHRLGKPAEQTGHTDSAPKIDAPSAKSELTPKTNAYPPGQPQTSNNEPAKTHTCTHEEQVQARIARMNGYTGGPNCASSP